MSSRLNHLSLFSVPGSIVETRKSSRQGAGCGRDPLNASPAAQPDRHPAAFSRKQHMIFSLKTIPGTLRVATLCLLLALGCFPGVQVHAADPGGKPVRTVRVVMDNNYPPSAVSG